LCTDHAGKDLWSYDMGPWKSQHGAGCSPILCDDLLILPNEQDGPTASMVALDKVTGSERWRTPRKGGLTAASTPVLFTPKTGGPTQVIVVSTAGGVTSIDPKNGKENWSVNGELNLRTLRSVSSPIATDELVLCTWGQGANDRQGVAIRPPAAGTGSAKVAYKWPTGKEYPYVPSPVVKGDLLFTWSDIGVVTCMRVANGEKVWQQKVQGTGPRTEFYSSPIIAGDKLYNITKDGEVISLAAADKFRLLGTSPLGDRCYATPAVTGNILVIRTASRMVGVGK
jgi:outer membrane protein assembly factor BamB